MSQSNTYIPSIINIRLMLLNNICIKFLWDPVLQFTWPNDFIYKCRCNSSLPKGIFLSSLLKCLLEHELLLTHAYSYLIKEHTQIGKLLLFLVKRNDHACSRLYYLVSITLTHCIVGYHTSISFALFNYSNMLTLLLIHMYRHEPRVSVQGFESLWGDCRFILADWGS